MRYVAPAIETRTSVKALMTAPISPGQIPSPRWKRSRAEGHTDGTGSHD